VTDLVWITLSILLFGWGVPWLLPKLAFLLRRHRDVIGLRLPFEGEWLVAVGGSLWRNHHLSAPAQQFAYDFVIPGADGKTYAGARHDNASYHCFGRAILAPHDGTVVVAVDGVPDNTSGELNPQMAYGNVVMIASGAGYVSVLAHLQEGSVTVRKGERVPAGQPVGACGNSGNSTEPHLHVHVQSQRGFEQGVGLRPHFTAVFVGDTFYESLSPKRHQRVRRA
jgi:hypothetical protein